MRAGNVPFDLVQGDDPLTVETLQQMAMQKEKQWQKILSSVSSHFIVPSGFPFGAYKMAYPAYLAAQPLKWLGLLGALLAEFCQVACQGLLIAIAAASWRCSSDPN